MAVDRDLEMTSSSESDPGRQQRCCCTLLKLGVIGVVLCGVGMALTITAPAGDSMTSARTVSPAPAVKAMEAERMGEAADQVNPQGLFLRLSRTHEIPGDSIDKDGNGFVDDVYGYDFVNDEATDQTNDKAIDEKGTDPEAEGDLVSAQIEALVDHANTLIAGSYLELLLNEASNVKWTLRMNSCVARYG